MIHANVEQFFWTASERENMKLRRGTGSPPPWTSDPMLSQWRFCNVHRADDRVSKWIIENLYAPWARPLQWSPVQILRNAVAARWINKIETLQLIRPYLENNDIQGARMLLNATPGPHFGAAYIIQSPTGLSKVDGIMQCIQRVWDKIWQLEDICKGNRLEPAHVWLMQFPHMGPFMAYQVVCDLAYTHLLGLAEDRMTWTCAGPGATRGLGWIAHDDPAAFNYNGQRDQVIMKAQMAELLDRSRDPRLWPPGWTPWELCTVQHWSCEYDKYRRGLAGQKLKRTYTPCS